MIKETEQILKNNVLIPVLRSRNRALAEKTLHFLYEANFTAVEITMTVPDACTLIKTAASMGFTAGAGTVLSLEEAKDCIAAGAQFIVSPTTVESLPSICHKENVFCIMGALSPSEVRYCLNHGADAVKIFPASSVGASHVSALMDIFPDTIFCPTGGITVNNVGSYIKAGAKLIGASGSLIDYQAVEKDLFETAYARIKAFREAL